MAEENKKPELVTESEIYKQYQANVRLSEVLQEEMLLGTRRGEDPCLMLIKAAKVISSMVGDNGAFAREIAANMQAVYGLGLGEKAPLENKLAEAEARLERLVVAEANTPAGEDKKRMKTAIKDHQELIASLKKMTE